MTVSTALLVNIRQLRPITIYPHKELGDAIDVARLVHAT